MEIEDTLDFSERAISDESVAAAVEFTAKFSHELQRYKGRLTASPQETACARAIRSRLEYETGVPVRMEAYKARPALGRSSFCMLGVWFLLSYALYYISFAGGRTASILLSVIALVNFAVGSAIILLLFLGNRRLSRLLPEGVSYNVVSEFSKNRDRDVKERVIIIADSHDAVQGSVLKDYGVLRKLTMWLCPISALVFVVFSVVKMVVGTGAPNSSLKISLFTVVPAVLGVFGIVVALLHYSPLRRHAKLPNGVSNCVAMATYSYFAEQPALLPDDVRIVYASFGGENSSHSGEEAFIKAHPEFADARVICIGEMSGEELKLAEYDPIRRLTFSTEVTSALSGAAHDMGDELTMVRHATLAQKLSQLHGYTGSAFARAGIQSATLLSVGEHAGDDVAKRGFEICVNSVFKLIDSMPAGKKDEVTEPSPKTEVQMHTISSR